MPVAAQSQLTVLVVDDEPIICKVLVRKFEGAGYNVLTAQNGREALEKLHDDRVHLVIADVDMPVMNGYNLAEQIPDIPVIFISGHHNPEEEFGLADKLHLDSPLRAFVKKPFDVGELLGLIQELTAP